jgi:phosphoglycerate dehydrogenase-like enzyme
MLPALIRIYVENHPGHDAFRISADQVRDSLAALPLDIEIGVHERDAPALDELARADFLVANRLDTARIAAHGRALQLVHCTNAGVERYMPLDWLPAGVRLTNSRGIHAAKAGEFGLMALLMLNQRIPAYVADQAQRRWQPVLTTVIAGKTALIVGTGGLGAAVARCARRMAIKTIGISRTGALVEGFDQVANAARLDQHLPEADFVVLACPLTDATRGLIDARRLALMKRGASLVNMARAGVADYEAVRAALIGGSLSGAVLDVFAPEPLPASAPWWDVPGLMMTPHVSCDSPDGYVERALEVFGENLRRLHAGEALINVVDPALGY